MKILVTGGAGFIGANFVRHVLAHRADYCVINLDKLTYAGNLSNLADVAASSRYSFIHGDICDASTVATAMRGCRAVVHFAAESHVDRSIYEPQQAIHTNIHGTFVLLQVAREQRLERFVHISTDEVYGDLAAGEVADESFPLRPSSPYSASKASADLLVAAFVRTFRLPAVIIRSTNNYGPHQFPEKFLPLMISNALEDKPVPVYGDGQQQRSWLYVEDTCRGILAVLENGIIGEVYNLGSPDVIDNLSLTCQVLTLLGKPASLIRHVVDRPGHDRRYAVNFAKIHHGLGWRPLVSLEEGLRKTIDWYSHNADWVAGTRSGEYRQYYQKYYENRELSLGTLDSHGQPSSD